MNLGKIFTILFLFVSAPTFAQRADKQIKNALDEYFSAYQTTYTTPKDRCRIDNVRINGRTITVTLNEIFTGQPFTRQKVDEVYRQVRLRLPQSYSQYALTLTDIHHNPLEQLVTDIQNPASSPQKRWTDDNLYTGPAWVEPQSRPYSIDKGLHGRHLSIWASHGKYYKNEKHQWTWQRPNLYTTNEDLFTQTIVVPFLIPMLQNAGAYVFTPRERDPQPEQFVVDNDTPDSPHGTYREQNGNHTWTDAGIGFAHTKPVYTDGENPFVYGTARCANTVTRRDRASTIRWTPAIEQSGHYAVYVSYISRPDAVNDARYTVCHGGIRTEFTVNQQMGSSTWVYLGTFHFDAHRPADNYVGLTNQSAREGTVSADAVRFGGGTGNIERGDGRGETSTSGLPRCLEGARYNAQWSGMPREVYSPTDGARDYPDDINTRSHMTNYLAGGSPYVPAQEGLRVPIELAVALHTDAGFAPDTATVGSLGIYTTDFSDGILPGGPVRLTSRDLCDLVLTSVTRDMQATFGHWHRRAMFDRNYSETRLPQVPSMILEMFSHQNFNDLVLGHDPNFKFHFARAVYKGILRYSAAQHRTDPVVQPLPVNRFLAAINPRQGVVRLQWKPTEDPLEPTATPTGYIVYVRKEGGDFDNGTLVKTPSFTLQVDHNAVYSFRVTAVNAGGESFPSETLAAMITDKQRGTVLIVDGFQRVAGPQPVAHDGLFGFDIDSDPGVPYNQTTAFCGRQTQYLIQGISEDEIGASGQELEGLTLVGNTFDHSHLHGRAIASVGGYSFGSATRSAVESGDVDLSTYHVVDLVLGLQRNDLYSTHPYPTLTPSLCRVLQQYTRMKGCLLVSGAYVADDQRQQFGVEFLRNTLKIGSSQSIHTNSETRAEGMNTSLALYTALGQEHYPACRVDCLWPTSDAFSTLVYSPEGFSAAVAYKGSQYRAVTLGFPFECIVDPSLRINVMRAFLNFLTK